MKLSIIVPVYQVEQYIRPCIESIFRQGLDDDRFEVIIVNDGSLQAEKLRFQRFNQLLPLRHDNISRIALCRQDGVLPNLLADALNL